MLLSFAGNGLIILAMKLKTKSLLYALILGLTGLSIEPARAQDVISAASPEATNAGMSILRKGGNAADAAVAIAFTLGVTESAMSGLGGQIQFLLKLPDTEPVAINGSSFAPELTQAVASSNEFLPLQQTTVPTWLKSLEYLFKNYGSGNVSWEEVMTPAIGYARDGFIQGRFRQKVFLRHKADLAGYLSDGYMLPGTEIDEGSLIVQPQLALTLEKIAAGGVVVFYQGEIADLIESDMIARGGWVRKRDLARVKDPVEVKPVVSQYNGHRIYSFPPPAGGWVMMQTLKLYENLTGNQPVSEDVRNYAMAKAIYLAQKNRQDEPITDFSNYSNQIEQKLSDAKVQQLIDEFDARSAGTDISAGGETTHFSLIDADGFAISATTSINAYYGTATASPGLGFLYNTYMDDFNFDDPAHPYYIKPFNWAYSSMSPTIVTQDGDVVLVLGSPGSARIISSVAQVVQRFVDTENDLASIVAEPRIHATSSAGLYLEDQTLAGLLNPLGLELRQPRTDLMIDGRNAYYGGIHAVGLKNGRWQGTADPRRDGIAIYR